jgi:hypothetical protein
MELQKIYVKDGHEIGVTSAFIYSSTIYKIWKNGAALVEEKSYSCNRPLNLDKIKIARKKDYILQQCFELESAPEYYLINKGYKIKNL